MPSCRDSNTRFSYFRTCSSQRDAFFFFPRDPVNKPPCSSNAWLHLTRLGPPYASGKVKGKRCGHCCWCIVGLRRQIGLKATSYWSVVHGRKWLQLPNSAWPVLKLCIFWKKKETEKPARLLACLRLIALPQSKLALKSSVQIIP